MEPEDHNQGDNHQFVTMGCECPRGPAAQGPCFYCGTTTDKTPNKPTVCDPCNEGIKKERENINFDVPGIKKARSNTLPHCEECKSDNVLAVRRNDIPYAVMACIDCNHRRQLTEAEYFTEWPECLHSPTGEPYGAPIFPCAWPLCPKGVETNSWVIAAAHPGISPGTRYERMAHKEGDNVYYSWHRTA
jgi:hypothetical protein